MGPLLLKLKPTDPKVKEFVTTVKGLALKDPFGGHPTAEFIHVRHPFHDEDVHEYLAKTSGLVQRKSEEGLDWVSKEVEGRNTTRCALVGYTYHKKTETGCSLISSWRCTSLHLHRDEAFCYSYHPSLSEYFYVVSPVLPTYLTSDSIDPPDIKLYAIVVESGVGRPFRVPHEVVFFRHEYRTQGMLKEERQGDWLRNVGKVCKDLAMANSAPNADPPANATPNAKALNGPPPEVNDEHKSIVDCLDEMIVLNSSDSDASNESLLDSDNSDSDGSDHSWYPTYRDKSSEESAGSSGRPKRTKQGREEDFMDKVPKGRKRKSPCDSGATPSATRGDIALSMEEEVIASELELVNKWVKRVRTTTTEIHESASPAAREAASKVWNNFFQEFKTLSKKSLENLRECATAS